MERKQITNSSSPPTVGAKPRRPSYVAPDTNSSEVPNTNGIVIWPDKILNEIKRLEQFDRAQKRKEAQRAEEEEDEVEEFFVEKLGLSESFEFYMMLVLFSVVWWVGVYYVLKLHKFPFHRHYFEAAAIFILPVVMIFVIFSFVDRIYNYFDRRKKNV